MQRNRNERELMNISCVRQKCHALPGAKADLNDQQQGLFRTTAFIDMTLHLGATQRRGTNELASIASAAAAASADQGLDWT